MKILRLGAENSGLARSTFAAMAAVFEEDHHPLGGAYLERLLRRDDFWAFAALVGDEIVGGLTAHVLPMTRSESCEIFLYDIAVRRDYQRQGVGRSLVTELRRSAAAEGIADVFVPAENDDVHALDFYRSLGGVAAAVTFFTFSSTDPEDD